MQTASAPNAVSQAFAANGRGPMVYGRYRDHGYAVNPLTAKLGTLVPEGVTATKAFAEAGLDWTAEKRPVYFMGADGPVTTSEHCSIVRSDTDQLLGIHGRGYEPVQNSALINLLDYLREDVDIETVLSIREGRRVFVSCAMRTEADVVPGDKVRRYLHAFNSHDGSSSFGVFFSDVRLACANQLNYLTGRAIGGAVRDGSGLRMKHTASVTAFAQRLPELINLERRDFTQSMDELRALSRTRLTPELATQILGATFADKLAAPIKDKQTGDARPRTLADLPEIGTIRQHYSGASGLGLDIEGVRGTVYGLYNAITQFESHDAGRSKDEIERARTRLISLWGGPGARRIERAREACLAAV